MRSAIVATYREGDFHYRIPLDNGRYQVKLTFVEPSTAGKARRFSVLANKRVAIGDLDLGKAAPTAKTAVERIFPVEITDGLLDLHFRPTKGQAIVSAIEVVR